MHFLFSSWEVEQVLFLGTLRYFLYRPHRRFLTRIASDVPDQCSRGHHWRTNAHDRNFRALNFFINLIAASPQKSFKRKKKSFFKNYKKKGMTKSRYSRKEISLPFFIQVSFISEPCPVKCFKCLNRESRHFLNNFYFGAKSGIFRHHRIGFFNKNV